MLYQLPWPVVASGLVSFFVVLLGIELVVAMARFAVNDDAPARD